MGDNYNQATDILELCASGWDGDIHFLGFNLILIPALAHIMYLITSSPDVRNASTAISFFGDIMESCFTESAVDYNVMCAMKSCGMCTWIYRYIFKRPKQTSWIFEVFTSNCENLPVQW